MVQYTIQKMRKVVQKKYRGINNDIEKVQLYKKAMQCNALDYCGHIPAFYSSV